MFHASRQEKGQGTPIPIPAPSGGMNTRANYLELPANKARWLKNFIPTTGRCVVRPGYSSYADIEDTTGGLSLMEYRGETGTTLLAAASDGDIYSVSSGSVSSKGSGYSQHPWSWENLNGYLIAVNGADTGWSYNGSTLAALTFTGVTLSTLRTVKECGNRLWFTVNNSASPWYGPVAGVSGALTKFDLKQIAKGGKCLGVYPWQSSTVFIMSTGEVLVYSGDPSTDFTRQGAYWMPPPVGYDPAVKVGNELIIMTSAGPIPMQYIVSGLAFDADSLQSWSEIQPSWTADFADYGANVGWSATYHGGMVYFNIPTSSTTAKQWVNNLNIPGGAWTFYGEMNAGEFARTSEGLFFIDKSAGRVCKHTGATDISDPVIAEARPGYILPSQGRSAFEYTLARVNYDADGIAYSQIVVDVDFRETDFPLNYTQLSVEGGGGAWDDPWDSAWGEEARAQLRWQKIHGVGRAVAPCIRIKNYADSFQWFATDVLGAQAGVRSPAGRQR